MSYAIHPYAVSVDAIKKTLGSNDRRLLKKLIKRFRGDFPGIDELNDEAVTVEKAISDLIMGAQLDESSGFKYGYALKFLCEDLGAMLTNAHWSAMGWDWIEDVDAELNRLGLDADTFRVEPHLTTRGAPISLPQINDFPSIGYLLEAELAKASLAFADIKYDGLMDDEIRDSITEIRKWFDTCPRKHVDLVCFYH